MSIFVNGRIQDEVLVAHIILIQKGKFNFEKIVSEAKDYGIESKRTIKEVLEKLYETKRIKTDGINYWNI